MIGRSGNGQQRDDDLDEELRTHLDMAARDRIAGGMSPAQATTGAQREFGNLGQVKEVTRSMWRHTWWEQFWQDLRYALRMLARTPGLAVVGVLTLALGIGANTAIFSVVRGVLLKPLEFPHPERLVFITSQFPTLGFDQFPMDAAEFVELRERAKSFQEVGAYATGAVNIGASDRPSRVTSALASASLFNALDVAPRLGRGFTAEETLPNASPVVVLSWELWQSSFGGRQVIGQKIDVDGLPTMVVGVMPPRFDVHDQGVRIWLPLQIDPANLTQYRGGHGLFLIGRLKPNVTMTQARAELEVMLHQWLALDGGTSNPTFSAGAAQGAIHTPNADRVATNGGTPHRLRYDDLRADMIGSAGTALWVLQAAVGLVLLIACANLANLLLMRAETRQKELAVRLALGAGRGHLLRQFLTEGLVLSLGGAVAGVILAQLGVRALVSGYASSIPRAASVGLDGPVLGFTLLLAIGTGLVFGLAPLLHVDAKGPGGMLRDASNRSTATLNRRRVQRGLVIAEIAMAVTLVIGAGLLVRSLWNLLNVDAGFRRDQLVTFQVALPPVPYADSMRRVVFFENLTHQLAAIPGVKDAAAMQGLPPLRQVNANDTQFENYVVKPGGPQNNVDYWQWVTPTYLATMGGKIVAGRDFSPADGPNSPPVVLVNQTLAKLYYPGEDPLGRRVKPGGSKDWFTIVGVVKDVKQGGVDSKTGTELYIDYDQSPSRLGFAPSGMNVVLRSSLPAAALAPEISRVVAALDPSLPIAKLRSMDEVFSASVSRPRFLATLLGVFAIVAMVLAAIGTYGVLAYAVTQRHREIGIRMALGARASEVLSMVLAQGLRVAGVGLVVGLIGAAALTRVTGSLLFGVKATDPATFGAVAGLMTIVVAVACIVPARRATRVDPIVALRAD